MIDARSLVAVALLAAAAHATALGGGYVWLDHAHLERGLALARPGELPALFTHGFAGTGFYRPLVAVSLSLDALLVREPWFFRAVTLGWHALASVMTLVAARKLGVSRGAALVAACLFAVHPLTGVVASVTTFRSEAMLLVFLLGLVVAHVDGRALLAAATLFAAAVTKETGWLLGPAFVVALEATRSTGTRCVIDASTRRGLLAAEGLAAVAATSQRLLYAPDFRARHAPLDLSEHIGTRLAAFAKSALSLVVPVETSVCDAFPVTNPASPRAAFGAAAFAGLVILVITWRRRSLVWLFAISLLPSIGLVPLTRFWSPHYLYLPLAFGAMLVSRAADRHGLRAELALAAAGVAFFCLTLVSNRRFTSDERLFAAEVLRDPSCREAQFYLGDVARERGDLARAAFRYEAAATQTPGVLAYVDEQAAWQNLGAVRLAQKRHADARSAWTRALELTRDEAERRELEHNLAVLALDTGAPGEAARLLEAETKRSDALPEALFVHAKALHALGRDPEAGALIARLRTARATP